MDPTTPEPNQNTLPQPNPPSAFGSSGAETPLKPRKSHKKLFMTAGIILTVLIIVGAGLSIWAIQNHSNQLALQAKREAALNAKKQAEAKAREGTIADANDLLDIELKQIQEANDRSIFSLNDRLKQEVDGAITIGSGNENGL